jgi:hypothetical protein
VTWCGCDPRRQRRLHQELKGLMRQPVGGGLVRMRITNHPQFIRDVNAAGFRTCRPTTSSFSASTGAAG